jgi:hypothetical protein
MPMLVIAGSFQIEQTQPNGDSMRFNPNDPKLWDGSAFTMDVYAHLLEGFGDVAALAVRSAWGERGLAGG